MPLVPWDHALPWQPCLALPGSPCGRPHLPAPLPLGSSLALAAPYRIVYEVILKHSFKCQSAFPSWTCYMVMCYFLALGSRPDCTFYGECGKRSKNFFLFFLTLLCSVSRAITVMPQRRLSSCDKSHRRKFEEEKASRVLPSQIIDPSRKALQHWTPDVTAWRTRQLLWHSPAIEYWPSGISPVPVSPVETRHQAWTYVSQGGPNIRGKKCMVLKWWKRRPKELSKRSIKCSRCVRLLTAAIHIQMK